MRKLAERGAQKTLIVSFALFMLPIKNENPDATFVIAIWEPVLASGSERKGR